MARKIKQKRCKKCGKFLNRKNPKTDYCTSCYGRLSLGEKEKIKKNGRLK